MRAGLLLSLVFTAVSLQAAGGEVSAILRKHCQACHSPNNRQGGFDVTTREKLLEGGDRGPGVIPGNPDQSPVLQRIRHELKPGMPLGQPQLAPEVIETIAAWIKDGARFDEEAPVTAVPVAPKKVDHWSFKPPVKPPVPTLRKHGGWARTPVDAFLAAEWEKKGLTPSPQADKRILLRRVSIDLTGLPPTSEETAAFLADNSAGAYEKVVDRLLASPRYGERWGRHWMDVWRYADWYGRRLLGDQRFSARHIWRWRDWIVESVNEDKGYDQMIREMIAGDEIAPGNPDVARATGYLARSFHRFNRNVWLQDTVENIGFGFLGITLKCARCHDHKYDPIPQEDYYRFRAFFEPYDVRLERVKGESNLFEDGLARVYDAPPRKGTIAPYSPPIYKETFRFIRGDETNPDKTPLSPGTPSFLGKWAPHIEPVKLPRETYVPDLRPFVRDDLLQGARQDIQDAELALSTSQRLLAEARGNATKPWQEKEKPKQTVDYANDIARIFTLKCRQCHGGLGESTMEKGGLSVANLEMMLRGGRRHGPAVIPGHSASSPLIRHVRGELSPRMPAEGQPLEASQIALLARWIDEMPERAPEMVLKDAVKRQALAEKRLDTARAALPSLEARIAAEVAKHSGDAKAADLAKTAAKAEQKYALVAAAQAMTEAQQYLAEEKAAAAKGKFEAAAKALAQGAEEYTPVFETFPETSTGRRTALAGWLAGRENPLVARVAVNHMWLRHFGKPLAPTVTNFGRNGKLPLNQALLDWMAVQFMDDGWSMKKLHRTLVTSNAYRMISSGPELAASNQKIDPDNNFFWRMSPRRLEAEVVRDTVLYLAGSLDEKMGGPDIDDVDGLVSFRRSIYLRHSPENQVEFLKLYDQPNPTECYMRTESVIPQQALASTNSSLALESARTLGRKLSSRHARDEDFVRYVFVLITGIEPSKMELVESRRFLSEQAAMFRSPQKLTRFSSRQEARVGPSEDPELRARENFVHAMFNHNEFLTAR